MMSEMRSVGFRLPDGTMVEEIWDPRANEGAFVIRYASGHIKVGEEMCILRDRQVRPLEESVIKTGAVLLPGDVGEPRSPTRLLEDIRTFVCKYVDLGHPYDYVAASYVLLSWVYDAFTALPYLHLVGDIASGKSRALTALGNLVRLGTFANGAITPAVIFRILERYRGTLVLDEADFDRSAVWPEILKILNSGYHLGFPVLRMERVGKAFEPRAYRVFGPKLIASRKPFPDDALISRCIVIPMRATRRQDIPLNLPPEFQEEALALRNRLLGYRLRQLADLRPEIAYLAEGHEPRLSQVLMPLRQVAPNREFIDHIETAMQNALQVERGASLAAEVLEAILALHGEGEVATLTMKAIADRVRSRLEEEGEDDSAVTRVTPRKVGEIVRRDLGLAPLVYRAPGRNVSGLRWDHAEMAYLAQRFGLRRAVTSTTPTTPTAEANPGGGVVDVVGRSPDETPGQDGARLRGGSGQQESAP
jgi:hypothetical protein